MMLRSLLVKPFSNPMHDARIGRWACHAIALCVLVLGILDISARPLTEFQLLVGTVLIIQMAMLMVILGYLIPIVAKLNQDRTKNG